MFGFRKLLKQILARLETLESVLENAYANGARSAEQFGREAQQLQDRLQELRGAANIHDMAIEDLLDSWEEMQSKQREETRELSAALAAATERELKQYAEREEKLTELVMTAYDQLYGLRRAAVESHDEVWERQLALAWRKLNDVQFPAGFLPVCEIGVPVNYAVHEVIGVTEPESPEQKYQVAEICSCGYVRMGEVLRKAKIIAYTNMNREEDHEPDHRN